MKAEKNTVVSFHYQLKDDNNSVLDSSFEGDAISFIMGYGQILEGLEGAIKDKLPGDQFKVTLPPEKAYGQRDENKIKVLDKSIFGNEPVFEGMQFNMVSEENSVQYETIVVVGLNNDTVTVDGNHVMAGARLNFDVQIISVREALAEELVSGELIDSGNINSTEDIDKKKSNRIDVISS